MKVLFDQNVPRNLANHLKAHEVTRSVELGWQELKNGDLLEAAQDQGFELSLPHHDHWPTSAQPHTMAA